MKIVIEIECKDSTLNVYSDGDEKIFGDFCSMINSALPEARDMESGKQLEKNLYDFNDKKIGYIRILKE